MTEPNRDDSESVGHESLDLARALVGEVQLSDQQFLELMARSDRTLNPADGETCGATCHMLLDAQVARDMLEAGEYEEVMSKWVQEAQRRWRETKFFKLWQAESAAGRDPNQAFAERGWTP